MTDLGGRYRGREAVTQGAALSNIPKSIRRAPFFTMSMLLHLLGEAVTKY